MRLSVKRGYSIVNEQHFSKGPVYIGRHPKSQVCLPDRAVSRQHAVLLSTDGGDWMAQDLESANCTTVNGRAISKVPLREGDIVGIADFTIEVHFEPRSALQMRKQPIDLGETIVGSRVDFLSIYQTSHRANLRINLDADYLHRFYKLDFALFGKNDEEALLATLTDTLLSQLDAYHVWAGLKDTPDGPLTLHCGRSRSGEDVTLEELLGRDIIKQTIERESYVLLPNLNETFSPDEARNPNMGHIKSAMSAPIVTPSGVYGVLYLDNGINDEAFTQQDLDYLTLVSTHVAALIEHIG